MTTRRSHHVVKDPDHGNADHTHPKSSIRPLGRLREDVVEHGQHVAVVADLPLGARRVLVVRLLERDLLPHLVEVHVDAGVALDQLLELLQHGDQLLLRRLVDVVDLRLEPFVLDAVVRRKPGAMATTES